MINFPNKLYYFISVVALALLSIRCHAMDSSGMAAILDLTSPIPVEHELVVDKKNCEDAPKQIIQNYLLGTTFDTGSSICPSQFPLPRAVKISIHEVGGSGRTAIYLYCCKTKIQYKAQVEKKKMDVA
ncbi:MAG: hypothetical protein K0S27_623 [Gammaproteobacteria bacterium]|jgi:hypothetical protein|nr:hypothetical protein [Gammaproteobacteria bacterium]